MNNGLMDSIFTKNEIRAAARLAREIIDFERKVVSVKWADRKFNIRPLEEGGWGVIVSYCQIGGCEGHIREDTMAKAVRRAKVLTLFGKEVNYRGIPCGECLRELGYWE